MRVQSEAEVAAHEALTVLSFNEVLPLVSPVCRLLCSGTDLPSKVVDTEILGDEMFALFSRCSIIRDTVPTSTLPSSLTSELESVAELLRENNFSFQPFVLFVIDSLYLDEIVLNRDLRDSEND